MAPIRRILIFIVLTAVIILVGRLVPRVKTLLPALLSFGKPTKSESEVSRDSTNALPDVVGDTTGGRWHERLFQPLLHAYQLPARNLKRKPGYWEVILPKGMPIHEYALQIERICREHEISVLKGAELRPPDRSVEYHLESQGQVIKLRASLGKAFMAGSARLAIVFTGLDSLREMQLASLEGAAWEKTLVVNPDSPNSFLKKLRYTGERNEVLLELPMEPAAYPYVDPGPHALFIHHTQEEVVRILSRALDSFPKARGFASKYGDRAIENQPLLERLFLYTAARKLIFLDLTGSQRSLARQVANSQDGRCRAVAVFKDSLQVVEELARKAAIARKSGEAVLVVPYSASGYRNLERSIQENEIRFNQMGLELVTLSGLTEGDPGLPPADRVKP